MSFGLPLTATDSASLPDPYVPPDGTFNITGSVNISADLTLAAFTPGSILFAGTGGLIAQDNANLFWDDTNNQLVLLTGTAAAPSYTFASDQDTGMYRTGANGLAFAMNGAAGLTLATTGATATQAISTSGSPTLFTLTGAAHTTLAASTEATDVNVNLARTVQFATGALATQRAVRVQVPTYGFVAASTITNAATFYVEAAPVAGTNATITSSYAVWIDAGATRTDGVIFAELGSVTNAAYSFLSAGTTDPNTGIYSTGADNVSIAVGGTQLVSVDLPGVVIAQAIRTGGSPLLFRVTGAAHTTLTAGTEDTDVSFNLGRSVQFATGAIATQRAIQVVAPTYAFVGASTITNAATFYIDAAPVAGTNATITNAYAVWIDAGNTRTDGVIFAELGSVTAAAYSFLSAGTTDPNTGIYSTGADNVSVAAGGTQIASFATTGTTLTQAVSTSGSPVGVIFTGAAHTSLAALTEASDVDFRLDRTVQFATGAITTQRAFQIANPTYGFVAASTITNAATFYIEGAPVAGTNATITNAYAIWVDAGVARFDGQVQVASALGLVFQTDQDTGLNNPNANELTIVAGNSTFASFRTTTGIVFTPPAQASGTPVVLTLTGGAHTGLTASTEVTDVNVNLARTVEFATGALTTQRAVLVQAPTYAFVGASTLTTAATMAISGAPTQGTNATITSSIALLIAGGAVTLASASGASSPSIALPARTLTYTGTTQITETNSTIVIGSQTYTDTSAVTLDVAATLNISAPVGAGSVTITSTSGYRIAGNVSYAAHGAGFNYAGYLLGNHTITFTGTTGITAAAGAAGINIGQITLTNASAHTITNAASLYISGALIAGGSVTITNNYALWVDAGIARFDGDGVTVFTLPTVAATDTVISRKIRILDGATTYWVAATTSQ